MSTAMTAIPKFRDSLTYNFSKLRFGNGEISENKMLKMTVIMIGGFLLSCLPIVVFYFWRIFERIKNGIDSHSENCDSSSKFFFGAFHFSYINAFLNIMIYSVMSKSFRKALKTKLGVDKDRRSIHQF